MKLKSLLLAGLIAFVFVPIGSAQVLIYSMSFNTTGPSVNFGGFQGGYAVVDFPSGSFSTVMILTDPTTNRRYYTTSLLSGSYFELLSDSSDDIYGVLTSGGGSSTSESLSLQVLGKTSPKVGVGSRTSLPVAKQMRGFLLANSNEVSSTDENGNTSLEYGLAGSTSVRARFDATSTRDANNLRLSVDSTIAEITNTLELRGIGPEATPTPSPSPTPDPDPTPTPTPTPDPTPEV